MPPIALPRFHEYGKHSRQSVPLSFGLTRAPLWELSSVTVDLLSVTPGPVCQSQRAHSVLGKTLKAGHVSNSPPTALLFSSIQLRTLIQLLANDRAVNSQQRGRGVQICTRSFLRVWFTNRSNWYHSCFQGSKFRGCGVLAWIYNFVHILTDHARHGIWNNQTLSGPSRFPNRATALYNCRRRPN